MRVRPVIAATLAAVTTAAGGCDKSAPTPPPPAASQPAAAAASDAPPAAPPPMLTGKARDRARRKSTSNLHQIGLAILLYQGDHKQQFPPDLGALVGAVNVGLGVFVNPATGHVPPAGAAGLSTDDKAAWVNAHADYGYARPADPSPSPSRVLCYEKPDATDDDGLTLLYADGHAEWVPRAAARRQIDDAVGAAAK